MIHSYESIIHLANPFGLYIQLLPRPESWCLLNNPQHLLSYCNGKHFRSRHFSRRHPNFINVNIWQDTKRPPPKKREWVYIVPPPPGTQHVSDPIWSHLGVQKVSQKWSQKWSQKLPQTDPVRLVYVILSSWEGPRPANVRHFWGQFGVTFGITFGTPKWLQKGDAKWCTLSGGGLLVSGHFNKKSEKFKILTFENVWKIISFK